MRLRIISGKYGGRFLDSPKNHTIIHPMSERARNAIFNSIGNLIVNKRVLDVFAGTGSVGLEAISRGASSSTFIEKNRIAQKIIQNNLKTLNIPPECGRLIKTSLHNWLKTSNEKYDFIFADPPYNNLQLETIEKLFNSLNIGGFMILSYPDGCEVPWRFKDEIVVVDNRNFSKLHFTTYQLKTQKSFN